VKLKKIKIEVEDTGLRLDQFLLQENPDYSRSYFSDLIKKGSVAVNNEERKPSYRLKTGDTVEYKLTEKTSLGPIKPVNIPLNIIFEDENVLVVNKPAGLVVHPAVGHHNDTLVNALTHSYPQVSKAVYDDENELSVSRPGLVHRLDKDTSGVLIVAKNTKSMIFLANQIQDRKAKKVYLALCAGWPPISSGRLYNNLGRNLKNRKIYTEVGSEKGREAISNYQVKKNHLTSKNERVSLIEFQIETGRTHQIRTQAKMAGFPIIGDQAYSTKESEAVSNHLGVKRQMLHASSLTILLPGAKIAQKFEVAVPSDFEQIIENLIAQN